MSSLKIENVDDQTAVGFGTTNVATAFDADTNIYLEYCKYCDESHGPRDCQILLRVMLPTTISQYTPMSCTRLLHATIDYGYDPERLSAINISTMGQSGSGVQNSLDYSGCFKNPVQGGDRIFGGYLPSYLYHLEDSAPGPYSSGLNDIKGCRLQDPITFDSISRSTAMSEPRISVSPEDTPIYQSCCNAPEIQSPTPIRMSPEPVETRLLANHCKNCGELYENCGDEKCALDRWERLVMAMKRL